MNLSSPKTALFAGSFDPITLGHESIALRASALFDKLYIGIGKNGKKQSLFTLEQRLEMLNIVFADVENVEVIAYDGLTVDLCRQKNISYMVRGVRSVIDFDMELSIAHANSLLKPDVETVFLLSEPQHIGISSSAVRDIIIHGGKLESFVPESIVDFIRHY